MFFQWWFWSALTSRRTRLRGHMTTTMLSLPPTNLSLESQLGSECPGINMRDLTRRAGLTQHCSDFGTTVLPLEGLNALWTTARRCTDIQTFFYCFQMFFTSSSVTNFGTLLCQILHNRGSSAMHAAPLRFLEHLVPRASVMES